MANIPGIFMDIFGILRKMWGGLGQKESKKRPTI